jgi:hypothetical protein
MWKIGLVALLLAACGSVPDRVTIAITADGYVKLDGKAVTFDQLGTLLAVRRERGPREDVWQTEGVSALPVLLDPDDAAAWQHVGWVMTILAEQKFWRLSFPGGRTALQADTAIWPTNTEPDGQGLLCESSSAKGQRPPCGTG